jgi:hypothetical protein
VLISRLFCTAAVILGAAFSARSATIPPTVTYLQQKSDQYQQTVDIYTDADAAGNHFAARGEIDSLQADLMPTMDEISTGASCFGITCITATFNLQSLAWGGWYFLNGVLGASASAPSPSWGDQPNVGYDLTGAIALRFWAKGALGGEVVHFFAFGVGNTAPPFQPYPDSSAKIDLPVVLSTTWSQYSIPLVGVDMHYVLGGFGWVANRVEAGRLQPAGTFYIDNIQYIKARPNDPRLLVSYETVGSPNVFDAVERNAAFVYDNSVALMAFLAAGDLGHAQTIADSLVYAQAHDRFFTDGRVRNAYQGGDISLPPGWLPNDLPNTVRMPGWYDPGHTTWYEDESQVSSNTGNIAWAALALLDMWETTKNPQYLAAAEALGGWALSEAAELRSGAAGLLGGFTGGYDGWENGAASASAAGCASGVLVKGQCKRLYKSTEHNIDLYSVFSRLYLADGASKWANAAQQAKHFFLSMWDPQEGKFWTGTGEDGATIFEDVIPLDIQAWALQALGTESLPYQKSLGFVEANHKTTFGYGFKQNGANACGDYTWFEGTSQVAVAYWLAGDRNKWQSIVDGVHSVQTAAGGVPATDGPCLNTGFNLDDGSPWEYFPRIHVGATAWLSLAENGVNPYKANIYSPAVGSQTVSFGGVPVGAAAVPQVVSFANPGATPLAIRGVALAGSNSQDFRQINTCGAVMAPGQTCTISVGFSPSGQGPRSASIAIVETSDPAMSPVSFTIALSGSGTVATPAITWQPPAAITFGSALGSPQLNATANVPGTFVYTPPAGTVLPVGVDQTLSALFSPFNASGYTSASASVPISVNASSPAIATPNLILTDTLTRDSNNNIVAVLNVANNGGSAAQNIVLGVAKMAMTAGTPVPQIIGTIDPYSVARVSVTFPASVGASGTVALLTLSGAYSGGIFNSSVRVVLP